MSKFPTQDLVRFFLLDATPGWTSKIQKPSSKAKFFKAVCKLYMTNLAVSVCLVSIDLITIYVLKAKKLQLTKKDPRRF